jgi:RecA-family ATPase
MNEESFLELINTTRIEMDKNSIPDNPYADLGNMKKEGYDLSKTLEQKYLFNQPGPFQIETGFIPEGIVCMLVSPGGCGKTYALMQCAIAAATKTKWFDYYNPTKNFKTLFIAAEEDRTFVHNRMKFIASGLGFINNKSILEKIYENIHMISLNGKMHRLTNEKGQITDHFKYLKNYLEENPEIKLVCLDPASRFLGPSCEIDNAAATDWVAALNEITQIESKPTIIVSHHANKSAIRPISGGREAIFDQSITRGASGLVDGVRLVLGMQRKEEDKKCSIVFKIFKTNVCDTGEHVELTIDRSHGGILIPKEKDLTYYSSPKSFVNTEIVSNNMINDNTNFGI